MRVIKILTTIGLVIAGIYIFWLGILALQLASDRSYCRNTNLDQMSKTDYQYCLKLNAGLK